MQPARPISSQPDPTPVAELPPPGPVPPHDERPPFATDQVIGAFGLWASLR